jgi:NADPH-dependent curcumin reductase CurA
MKTAHVVTCYNYYCYFSLQRKLIHHETVTTGFENISKAFIGMLRGENTGKAIVKA